jgi:HlyD family secretion protein
MKYPLFYVLIVVMAGCHKNESISPIQQPITESVYASGIVKSRDQYEAHSTVNGLVQEIFVREGEDIQAGQPLMRIGNEPSRLNKENAKLAAAYADFAANQSKLRQAETSIGLLLATMKNDSLLLDRQRKLWSQNIGTLATLEQRALAYKNSTASYQQAKSSYQDLSRDLSFHSNESKNNLDISTSQANDYVIRSIIAGKVYKLFPDRGEFINTSNPLAIIGDAHDFIVELNVDEYDIARLHENQRVIMTMDSYKGKIFEGQIAQIEPMMDEASRSFVLKALFITRPPELYPNLSVQANIVIESKAIALTIPRSYLLGDSVVIMANGDRRKVVVGAKDYQRAEIKKGLLPTDKIQKPTP